jgi:nitrate/nitrite transporter NarK
LGLAFLSKPAAIPLFVVAFTLMEATIPLHWVMVADFFGRKSFGTLRGIMSSFYSLGAFASPVMAGWVFDRTQSYTLALVVLGASIGLGGVFFCLLERRWLGAKATQASHLFGLPTVLRRLRQ